ncbi:MAG: electron transfer flavoprotein subunit beta/FixA family protein [Phycisphaerales bacterium]|jgi:electron transfer flavoprotein beta subunit|nr:electron transfer flavoprotein subunit beta/FixA family protein [Phycisphaerales bacterium]MBT7171397.1 electron transfer flavoprotein subunit beta/FixA family protein [Phycisphaerales bacterium]
MGYNIVVCAKQVPDTKRITGDAMKEDGTVNRAALPAIFNPEDLNALETALAVRDAHGGTVTVVTMGPPNACEILRDSLCRGADKAILVSDRRAAASDTLATSYILSQAVRKLNADLVFCGRQAIDGDTAQVGPQMAEKLGFTLVTYLEELINVGNDGIRVKRNVGNGWEDVTAKLPALVTVLDTANTPRPYMSKRLMKFKKAKCALELAEGVCPDAMAEKGLLIDMWDLDALECDMQWVGMAGSPTKVNRILSVVLAGGDYEEFEPTEAGAAKLVSELIEEHTIG